MNYIKEINAFYQKQETNALSANAANLWHTLMHVNNRAGWQQEITVAVSVLCCKANVSESTFKRARKELQEKGYIYFESQGGNRPANYQIISSEPTNTDHNNDDKDNNVDDTSDLKSSLPSKTVTNLDHNVAPLYKQDKTKQKRSTTAAASVTFFRENFGKISAYIEHGIMDWVSRLGEPLVLTAMKRALDRGKTSWGYTKAILKSWFDKGFQTVADTEQEVESFNQKQKNTVQTYKPVARPSVTREVVPDWFQTRHDKQAVRKPETAEEVAERAQLAQLIAAYSSG